MRQCGRVRLIAVATWFLLLGTPGTASAEPDQTIEFEGVKWSIHQADRVFVEQHEGRQALFIGGSSRTRLFLPDVKFRNGTVEADFAIRPRAIPGIATFQEAGGDPACRVMFFRHFSRSKSVADNVVEQAVVTRRNGSAVVLTIRDEVVRDGLAGRQLSHWFHVKLEIKDDKLRVFIDDHPKPVFELRGIMWDGNGGSLIGVCGGGFYLSNFQVQSSP